METKQWWQSKTIWFNTLMSLLIAFAPDALSQWPMLKGYVPANVYQTGFVALTIGNVILRAVTSAKITLK